MTEGSGQQRGGRKMASLRRTASPDAGSSTRKPAASDPTAEPPLPMSRRIGVLVVVGALGGSILLATAGGGTPGPTAPPGATSTPGPVQTTAPTALPTPVTLPPTVTPIITPPESPVLTVREWTAQVTIPDPGVPLRTLALQVFRNNRARGEPQRFRDLVIDVGPIQLLRGENRISVALVNAGGPGPRSEAVLITVDDQPPRIELRDPADGDVINGGLVTVRGATDPGLRVVVRNVTAGGEETVTADERGVFQVVMRLGPEANRYEMKTRDAAGNPGALSFTLIRGDGKPRGTLTLSRNELRLNALPAGIDVRFELRDAEGQLVDGADVTFSISPPGLGAEIYGTTTVNGVAEWNAIVLAREGAIAGPGFVTVRAVLGGGFDPIEIQKPFTIR